MWGLLVLLVLPLYFFVCGYIWDRANRKFESPAAQLNYVLGVFTAFTVAYLVLILTIRYTFFN